ncbi:hypothetical protein [Streptosporangium carneum]|uniref:Uncharacterized protein n=1 Tax=Streptosporangium carneum TaxID=47481 RepID=A0A9W6MDN2_9ACTN|nr:hypothetical protein [Streptosporangium carneum]GLK09988.1 hypothetical protein GCM10017600_33940 [Streptosporangium carneum]
MIKAMNAPDGGAPRAAGDGAYDVVAGTGAAGLDAHLFPARARRQVVMTDVGEPGNAPASAVDIALAEMGVDRAVEQRRVAAVVRGDGR